MAYVIAAPEMMTAAATDLAGIGSTLDAAHQAAMIPTAALVPAAADEVLGFIGFAVIFILVLNLLQNLGLLGGRLKPPFGGRRNPRAEDCNSR